MSRMEGETAADCENDDRCGDDPDKEDKMTKAMHAWIDAWHT